MSVYKSISDIKPTLTNITNIPNQLYDLSNNPNQHKLFALALKVSGVIFIISSAFDVAFAIIKPESSTNLLFSAFQLIISYDIIKVADNYATNYDSLNTIKNENGVMNKAKKTYQAMFSKISSSIDNTQYLVKNTLLLRYLLIFVE
ncbi:MAG: hypothetical protein AAF443_00610 [Chlamydiota bacterium]